MDAYAASSSSTVPAPMTTPSLEYRSDNRAMTCNAPGTDNVISSARNPPAIAASEIDNASSGVSVRTISTAPVAVIEFTALKLFQHDVTPYNIDSQNVTTW